MIGDSGTTTEAAASRWQALGIGDHNGGVDRGIWALGIGDDNRGFNRGNRRYNASEWTSPTAEAPVCLSTSGGLDNDNGGINWGSRRYNVSEWNYPTAEAPLCLRDQGIDNNDGGVGRLRSSSGLSDVGGGVIRRRVICDASKWSVTMTEAAGARRQAQGIYDNDRSVGGRRWARRLQQRQRMRQRRIDNAYKGLKTKTEAAADQQQDRWIGSDNGVLIFLAFRLVTVTLYFLCLVAVSFWYCFHQIPIFFVRWMK